MRGWTSIPVTGPMSQTREAALGLTPRAVANGVSRTNCRASEKEDPKMAAGAMRILKNLAVSESLRHLSVSVTETSC